MATLTFDYRDAMAVLGPLSLGNDPHSFDLCQRHAQRTSAPKGWQMVRHSPMNDQTDQVGSGE